MLVDTHCHLGDDRFNTDRAAVVARAHQAGVSHIVVVADSLETTVDAIRLAETHGLSATAGVHPHAASSWSVEVAGRIESALDRPVVVAVGETGLDYHYDHSPRDSQRKAFADQLALASRCGLPAVVHSRSADEDMAAMLRDTDAMFILHSFSSGPAVLGVALERGAFVSFSGMVTFRSWSDTDAVAAVPTQQLLVETDAPYLAPIPHRGKRNEPAYVARVVEKIATLRQESFDMIADQTTRNAARCFGDRVAQPPPHIP